MNTLKTLALAGFLGAFALATDANAGCLKKSACATTTVVACAPAPVATCAPAKKCGMKLPKLPKMGCHKKAVACETPVAYAAPVSYAAPVYAAPQASGQASMQR